MSTLNLNHIKYFPDRFYICLDGFDLNNLNTFADDVTFSQQQAIYLHEYYHYLTNITTFQGLREFNVHFQDRIRVVVNLAYLQGLNGFPIKNNTYEDCKGLVKYWNDNKAIIDSEDLNAALIKAVDESPNKSFTITGFEDYTEEMSMIVDGEIVKGGRYLKNVCIDGLSQIQKFKLTLAVLDEFLSSSIDEFLFEHNMADNIELLQHRPFYPYRLFDNILRSFNLYGLSTLSKILIAYFALHCYNPVVTFLNTLEKIAKMGCNTFEEDKEKILLSYMDGYEVEYYSSNVNYSRAFAEECYAQKRRNLGDTMTLMLSEMDICIEETKNDFFYFVRPFMVSNIDSEDGRREFLDKFKRIRGEIGEPVILQNHHFLDANGTDAYKNHLAMLIAIDEILDSLNDNKIAKRLYQHKYIYPVDHSLTDDIQFMPGQMPIYDTWHVALNELGLYGLYLQEKHKENS